MCNCFRGLVPKNGSVRAYWKWDTCALRLYVHLRRNSLSRIEAILPALCDAGDRICSRTLDHEFTAIGNTGSLGFW